MQIQVCRFVSRLEIEIDFLLFLSAQGELCYQKKN